VISVPPNTWVQVGIAFNPPWASSPAPVYGAAYVSPYAIGATLWFTEVIVTFSEPVASPLAPAVFVKSLMPVMHVQNLVTGQWYHRNVQGITSPSVTWNLNAADTFQCTLSPPRTDMMTSAGEPLLKVWRDACYLEEDGQIKWGGILTQSAFNGPQWTMQYTGFAGYPNGIPYEGANYVQTGIEAMAVVRYLWNWLQTADVNSNLGMVIDAANTGVLLGAQPSSVPIEDTLTKTSHTGATSLTVAHANSFSTGDVIRVGDEGTTYTVKAVSANGYTLTLNTALKGDSSRYYIGAIVAQVVPPTPYALYWYNSTDIGQEIEQIRQEAVFDWREVHAWKDAAKSGVTHTWTVGVPRLGARRTDLRFCEGENMVVAGQVTQNGANFADRVIGLGFGQGSSEIRATVSDYSGGLLNRPYVYTDAQVSSTARMTTMTRQVLQSMINPDAVTQVVVKDHPNAPLGSFFCGDDILVQLCTGWRNTSIWSRITSMTQDPTTDLMTLSLARSDSFTYLAESGQGGTL